MREDKNRAKSHRKVPTRDKASEKRPMPDDVDSMANSSKRSNRNLQAFLQEGVDSNNSKKRVLQIDEDKDITFTPKELRAVKYPKYLARLYELSKHEFNHAG